MTIDHVLLTRFNLPTPGVESLVRAQEGWLRDRQELFEKYCLPAVASQTTQDFQWIIYLDTQSPAWLKKRMAELAMGGLFTAIYRDEVPHDTLVDDLRQVTGSRGDMLLTTNLDNDDGIAVDFVQRLQSSVHAGPRQALYLSYGLIQQGERLFLRKDSRNAFCSVAERWDPVLATCWADWHTKLGDQMPVQEIGGSPGWLQQIHTGNVSNRVHGTRVGPGRYAGLFAVGLDEAAHPGAAELVVDRLFAGPARSAKDWIRRSAKNTVLRLGGKQGLDRLKETLAGSGRAGVR